MTSILGINSKTQMFCAGKASLKHLSFEILIYFRYVFVIHSIFLVLNFFLKSWLSFLLQIAGFPYTLLFTGALL